MTLQELFTPKLSKLGKNAYMSRMLDKVRRELKEQGCKGVEYKNKVFEAKQLLEREIANGIIRKYLKLTASNKKVFQTHILEHNLTPLFQTSADIHYQLPKSIKTDLQFTNHITKQNLFSTVFHSFKRFDKGKWEHCIFTKDNVGWISKDNNGYYRYFSKKVKTGVTIGFSLLDLIQITCSDGDVKTPMDYPTVRKKIATILNVSYRDLDYVKYQKEKYRCNQSLIDESLEWKSLYPNLHSLTKSQLYILDELHQFVSQNIMERRHAIKNEAVFFISIRHLTKLVNERLGTERHPSTVAAAINLFAVLGLLHKMPAEILTDKEELLQIAQSIQGNKNHFHLITFMTIPLYDENLLKKAEKMAKRLRKNKITTAKQITSKNLKIVLGEKKAKSIINVREVSIMKMQPNKLEELAEEALRDFPYEAFDKGLVKNLEETPEEEIYSLKDSSLFDLPDKELYEMSLQHFEQQEQCSDFEEVD
ncbi:hypothetical protein [Halalkalibacter akibai]|uniref:Uncharacterized protein n=1 Tax=Halalkalibacter akibai (strain ATCC 43226 / DSM 21942 / CIP 109018 / JCM 9157 / 1139) TaxID=1236973 RepID=W4QZQ8_HALA3|nr:hypothetical protein [Halalkalibacter akibai]GAE37387.1 hypothetical protein JCM9157_4663 [Halalkalibacter akibai JCM 9157]